MQLDDAQKEHLGTHDSKTTLMAWLQQHQIVLVLSGIAVFSNLTAMVFVFQPLLIQTPRPTEPGPAASPLPRAPVSSVKVTYLVRLGSSGEINV